MGFRLSDPNRGAPPRGAPIGQEADLVFAPDRLKLTRISGAARTSLIVSPVNGRLPNRADGQDYFGQWRARGITVFEGPEIRPASERCLNVLGPMAPMIPWIYNANARIVQTEDFIMIKGEMHAPRIIDLRAGSSPLGQTRWEGESRARWQDETLIIETTNFRPEVSWDFLKTSHKLHVIEHFQLLSDTKIIYSFRLIDNTIYTAPILVEMVLTKRKPGVRMYEFPCHEANFSLQSILRGARIQEHATKRL